MTAKPDKIYHIEHKPRKDGIDLIDRVKSGVEFAIKDGMDWVFIVENDDHYPPDYFNRFLPRLDKYDFIGDDKSCYYNINTNRWSLFSHPHRASLFTTAFRLSALNLFEWPAEGPNLDMAIWRYARHRRRKFIDTGAIGIKHGIGLCAGRGHEMKLNHADPDMQWLKAHVDSEAYVFYKSLRV